MYTTIERKVNTPVRTQELASCPARTQAQVERSPDVYQQIDDCSPDPEQVSGTGQLCTVVSSPPSSSFSRFRTLLLRRQSTLLT